MSSYEEKIIQLLKASKLDFVREKSYNKLRKGKYRFDFLVYVKGAPVLVEVQGMQHYTQVKKFQKSRNDLLKQKERDRRKIRYCLTHQLPLYVIPFWEVKNLRRASDIFQEKFLAKDMWKNDKDWITYQNLTKGQKF